MALARRGGTLTTSRRTKPSTNSHRKALNAAVSGSTLWETVFLIGLVVAISVVIWAYHFIQLYLDLSLKGDEGGHQLPGLLPPERSKLQPQVQLRGSAPVDNNSRLMQQSKAMNGGYDRFVDIALDLSALEPKETLHRLETEDPFGTRTFDTLLMDEETKLGRILTMDEIEKLFPCPQIEERITLPDFRIEAKAKAFRDGVKGTFLFFQHLRKAGGTNFCSLAEKNLPKRAQPRYYCMPDMAWSGNKNAGYLHSWSNEEITRRMEESGHRIAGNEWENFDPSRHFDLPAVFATSFRHPLDRALSQFRFECVEDRGCHEKDVHRWWDKRSDLKNIYTKTFADPAVGAKRYFRGAGNSQQRRQFMSKAIDTLSKFHIVLSMEWLAYASPQVKGILGFNDLSALVS